MKKREGQIFTFEKTNNQIYIHKCIGRGSYGQVYLGIYKTNCLRNTNGVIVAIKIVQKHQRINRLVLSQISVCLKLKKLKAQNIVLILDFMQNSQYYFIVFQYCDQGDLQNMSRYRNFSSLEIKNIVCQLLNGLKYLSLTQKIHRDIKESNIFFKQGILKIGDFGFTKDYNQTITFIGTKNYMSPELLNIQKAQGPKPINKYQAQVDIWALGVTIFRLYTKQFPYSVSELQANCQDTQKIRRLIKFDLLDIQKDKRLKQGESVRTANWVIRLIKACLQPERSRRTWDQVSRIIDQGQKTLPTPIINPNKNKLRKIADLAFYLQTSAYHLRHQNKTFIFKIVDFLYLKLLDIKLITAYSQLNQAQQKEMILNILIRLRKQYHQTHIDLKQTLKSIRIRQSEHEGVFARADKSIRTVIMLSQSEENLTSQIVPSINSALTYFLYLLYIQMLDKSSPFSCSCSPLQQKIQIWMVNFMVFNFYLCKYEQRWQKLESQLYERKKGFKSLDQAKSQIIELITGN